MHVLPPTGQHGHPGIWTSADVAAALEAANSTLPHGKRQPTPAELWGGRQLIDAGERICCQFAAECHRLEARTEEGFDWTEESNHWRGSAMDRIALPRAFVEHGYLFFKKWKISHPI